MANELQQKILEFTRTSVTEVSGLRKQAADLQKENDDLRSEVAKLKQSALELQKKASAPVFDSEPLQKFADLLSKTGLVKRSSASLMQELNEDPNRVISLFESFLAADNNDGDLVTIKSASTSEEDPHALWRAALSS